MERNNLSEAQWAWMLWQLLQRLSDFLWDRYEKDFTEFNLDDDLSPSEFL
jgi:hypothetical protein